MVAEQFLDVGSERRRQTEPVLEDTAEFLENHLSHEHLVLGHHVAEDVSTEAASGKCADNHVPVEEHPHDTTCAMSSSVRRSRGTQKGSGIPAIMSSDPPPIATSQPPTPSTLDRLVRCWLAKAPDVFRLSGGRHHGPITPRENVEPSEVRLPYDAADRRWSSRETVG